MCVTESVALEWRHNNDWAEGLNNLCKIKSYSMSRIWKIKLFVGFSMSLHAAPPQKLRNYKISDSLQNRMYQNKTTTICLFFFISYNPHNTAKQNSNSSVNIIKRRTVFALSFLHLLSGVFNGEFKDQFILDG